MKIQNAIHGARSAVHVEVGNTEARMSIHVASIVWRTELRSKSLKAVAMKLADCASDDGRNIWQSVARIARETELSERTVQYKLRALLELKLLIRVASGGAGPRDTAKYCFNMALLTSLNAETEAKWAAEDEASSKRKFMGPLPAEEVAARIGCAFMGAEGLYLLGGEKKGVPVRQALRRVGDLIRAAEAASTAR
jgi:hypothetical protein